jgi:undecaprenyl phosphate N,N'-diacetylbacillosamine 1-phosphate transferase
MYKFSKRIFDIFFSFFFLLISVPIIIITILLIVIIDFHSPFFIQERSGLNGKKIKIIKLQTMKVFDGKIKITKLGRLLRLTKIDEMPQLLNVIKNDMSLIGPRPLFLEFNKFYKHKHKYRINIKPGITGLAQIKIKDSTDWKRKFNFDYIYFKKKGYCLDIYILLETFILVLKSIFIKKARPFESIDYKKNFYDNYCK